MWLWILEFIAKHFASELANRLCNKTLSKSLLKVVKKWAKSLPSNASVNPEAIWIDPFTKTPSDEQFPFKCKLQDMIQSNEIPPEDVWFDALMERWRDIREHVEQPQSFFKLDQSQAEKHIRNLSHIVFNEFTEDPKKFMRAVIDALPQKSGVDMTSIEEKLTRFLKQQVEKQKKNLKYIPEVFTENVEAKEICRFFVAPTMFWNKIIWDIHRLNFTYLNRMLTKSGLTPVSVELPKELELPPRIDQVRAQSDRLLQILQEKSRAFNQLREADKSSLEKNIPQDKVQAVWQFWHLVQSAFYANSRNIEEIQQQVNAAKKTIVLITSEAGKGKTNFVCDLTENVLIKRSVPSAFFTARDFDYDLDNLLEYVLQRILPDCGNLSVETRIDLLKNLASMENHPFVLVIDGLNESQNTAKFTAKLEELLQQLLGYGFIKIILTCRREYIEYRFDNLLKSGFADEILHVDNLRMRECEEKKLVKKYFDFFKLSCTLYGNAYYILSQNPLMLRFFCEVHGDPNATEKKAIGAVSNIFKDRLFSEYLKKKTESILRTDWQGQGVPLGERGKYAKALEVFVGFMITNKTYCNVPIDKIDTGHMEAIERLIYEDIILRKDVTGGVGTFATEAEVINFTFDEFRDYLIASYLVTNVWPNDRKAFNEFTKSLLGIEKRQMGTRTEQVFVPSVVAEGVSRFIFQIARHSSQADLEEAVKTQEWYRYTYLESIFEIEDKYVRDGDVQYVKESFVDDIHSSSRIIYELIQRHDISLYKNLNIITLYEILQRLDHSGYSKLVNPVFENYSVRWSDYRWKDHFTWDIDKLANALRKILREERENPTLFELLIFLFAIPCRNYYSPALDLYDEFAEKHPETAIAQLVNNSKIQNVNIRAHVFEKLAHMLQKGHKIPNLADIVQDEAKELLVSVEHKGKGGFGVGTPENKIASILLLMEETQSGLLTTTQTELLKGNISGGFYGIRIC